MSKLKDRLFYYSSRQLYRRRRSYRAIFLVSVVLLTLVMTFFEMVEAYFLRDVEIKQNGTHHAVFEGQLYDYSEQIMRHKRVESAFAIPYTSRLASSDDASAPGKLTVPTPEICDYLDVRYLWGHEPGDGEIAVPVELYNAYGYLTAGEENELYFKASEMTYFPLTLSGIFETNNVEAQHVFVTAKTAAAIDRETGAQTKYDCYFRCKNNSNRYIGNVVHELFTSLKLHDSETQSRFWSGSGSAAEQIRENGAWNVYRYYINGSYLSTLQNQSAAPLVLISLPVIVVASLLLASFMANWMTANAPEYGILSAIGANRVDLCTISAGQILLIAAVSAVPVVLLSALASNIYISAYNAASSTDVDFLYVIPWKHLIESALWFIALSWLFTYLATARLTRQTPFVLISGSYRGELPFVGKTDFRLGQAKDRIRQLSLLTALRNIRSELIPAVVTTLICLICGAFVLLLTLYRSSAGSVIESLKHYESDTVISVRNSDVLNLELFGLFGNRRVYLTDENLRQLQNTEGVVSVSGLLKVTSDLYGETISKTETRYRTVCCVHSGPFAFADRVPSYACTESALPLLLDHVLEGDPAELFREPNRVILLCPMTSVPEYHVGDTIKLTGSYVKVSASSGQRLRFGDEQMDFTVAAVASARTDTADCTLLSNGLLFTTEGAAALGLNEVGCYDTAFVNFDLSLPNDVLLSTINDLRNDPAFLRFDFVNHTVQTDSERRIEAATTWMLSFFIGMLFLSFCTMTYVNSVMKVNREKRELSILRQLGADERDIYKTMRTQTYPTTALALALSLLLPIFAVGYLLTAQSNISATADFNHFSPEVTAAWRAPVFTAFYVMLAVWLSGLPIQLISGAVSVLGTVIPTKELLKSSVVEGIRKDTD